MKTTKFQADLASSDAAVLDGLMSELEFRNKADFLAKAIHLIKWAVSEKRRGNKIVTVDPSGTVLRELVTPELERVMPVFSDELPFVSTRWSAREVARAHEILDREPAEPTSRLVNLMRSKR